LPTTLQEVITRNSSGETEDVDVAILRVGCGESLRKIGLRFSRVPMVSRR
jgi:hypothetical protein